MRVNTAWTCVVAIFCLASSTSVALAQDRTALVGPAAYGDWRSDAPGVRRKLTPADMPAPLATQPVANPSRAIARPDGALPKAPPGFAVSLFAKDLAQPRVVRVAPNGDVFVAESAAGRVRVLRPDASIAAPPTLQIFAAGLNRPFGIAFYPPGPNPSFVYVATNKEVVRFAYHNGDLKAGAPPEVIVPALPGAGGGGHWTRDIAFSPDGKTMFVSVGSGSNVAEGMAPLPVGQSAAFEASHAVGAAWGAEENRADVLAFDPDGHGMRVFANGLRNCAGLTIQPENGALWCVVNERDILGDDLPPEYATRVKEGGFYGWPWYYIGAHEDPRHKGERSDLADKVAVPDILIQPHSAPLGATFYEADQFPPSFKGDAFVALHGSWNRAKRTGYKVVRLLFKNGEPTGEYEDFLVGFVADDSSVWGRPVDVAVAGDGSLLVSDDAGGAIWRVAHKEP
jgi:glucose/arabinose dehydrogenase